MLTEIKKKTKKKKQKTKNKHVRKKDKKRAVLFTNENIYIILGLLYDNSVYRLPKVAHFIADMKLSFSFIQCHYQESSDLRLFLSQAPAYS